MKLFLSAIFVVLASFAQAQTITPNESSIVLQSPKKVGINLNGPTYYQGGEIYKNLLWRNPGFEPDLYRDKFVAFTAGTTTTFTSPNNYDPVIANFWTGATFRLYRGLAHQVVCSGIVSGNTVAANNLGPVYTFASPCSSAVQEGDVILLRQAVPCTAESTWEAQGGGWWGGVSSGGKLLSECVAPYDGSQSLRMDATAAGSTAGVTGYIDTNPSDVGIVLNGQYTVSGFYKTVGSPTLTVGARRLVTSATGNPLNCSSQIFSASGTWKAFTLVCPASETNQVSAGSIAVSLTAQNGTVLLDDISFQKTSGVDPANTTVFRDELIATLKAHCAGASLSNVPCELRDWAGMNAEEIDNTIKPMFKRSPSFAGADYDVAPNGGGALSVGFEEFLQLCKMIDAEPYYTLPETTGPEDAGKWIEYINGASTTPYGALRAANGQSASWLTVFPTIHLPMGNENWNEGRTGQGLGYRPNAPDLYYDYSVDAAAVWNAMRKNASWPAGGTGIDLVLGFQDGNPNYGVTEAMARANPNSGELAPYTQFNVGDVSPLTALWNPLFYEVVANTTNPATSFFQQGNAIKAHGKLNVYEFDNGTNFGSPGLTQSVLDSFTDAAGYGTATALQALQHLTFGIVDQNFFSLDQFAFQIPGGNWVHNWGAVVDMGGATNALRPQELGMRMVNAAIIGPMYDCSVAKPTTSNLLANHNGQDANGTPATNNIPQEYAYCFKNGNQRSMVVINTDITNSHAISFAGAQAPSGQVVMTRYAPGSISATNESTANNPTQFAPQNVAINAPLTLTIPSADTLPPYSITRYDWTSGGTTAPHSTSTALNVRTYTPVAGSTTLTASVSPATASGSITFQDSGSAIGSVLIVKGSASLVVPSIIAGAHNYDAVYPGNTSFAASTSAVVSIAGSTPIDAPTTPLPTEPTTPTTPTTPLPTAPTTPQPTPTSLMLSTSNATPTLGSNILLSSTLVGGPQTGIIALSDNANLIGSANLSAGSATFTVTGITAGPHSYTTSYGGTSASTASQSPALVVVPQTSNLYLHTSFTEHSAGSALDQSSPAINNVSSVWSDPNHDWTFSPSGGIISDTPDLQNPVLIDAGHTDYTATYNLPNYGSHLLFRYTNLNQNLFVVTYEGEIDLYSMIKGKSKTLAVIYLPSTTGNLTVALHGKIATISAGGKTASATIPSRLPKSTKMGFFPLSNKYIISSLDVAP